MRANPPTQRPFRALRAAGVSCFRVKIPSNRNRKSDRASETDRPELAISIPARITLAKQNITAETIKAGPRADIGSPRKCGLVKTAVARARLRTPAMTFGNPMAWSIRYSIPRPVSATKAGEISCGEIETMDWQRGHRTCFVNCGIRNRDEQESQRTRRDMERKPVRKDLRIFRRLEDTLRGPDNLECRWTFPPWNGHTR